MVGGLLGISVDVAGGVELGTAVGAKDGTNAIKDGIADGY